MLRPWHGAHRGTVFGLGTLNLPQAIWPTKEAVTPGLAAQSSPNKMAAGQPSVLFGSGGPLSLTGSL